MPGFTEEGGFIFKQNLFHSLTRSYPYTYVHQGVCMQAVCPGFPSVA